MNGTPTLLLSVTLRTGETFSFSAAKLPRHWKSWVMQQCPYGTSFYGCTFSRERVAAAAPVSFRVDRHAS